MTVIRALKAISLSHVIPFAALCGLVAGCVESPGAAEEESGFVRQEAVVFEQQTEMLNLLNTYRARQYSCPTGSGSSTILKGAVPGLKINSKLATAADGHAQFMATNNLTRDSYLGVGLSTPEERVEAAGYAYQSTLELRMIETGGYSTATWTKVLDFWMRKQMCNDVLSEAYFDVGFGWGYSPTTNKSYVVVVFASPVGAVTAEERDLLLSQVNSQRASGRWCGNGTGGRPVAALKSNGFLAAAAHAHAQDMVVSRYLTPYAIGSDGSNGGIRIARTSYAARISGEALTSFSSTSAWNRAVEDWMRAWDCTTIMNGEFTEVGFGKTYDQAKNVSFLVVEFAAPGTSAPGCGILKPGEALLAGQNKLSCDGRFSLVMQGDGNLVLYQGSKALWNSATNGRGGQRAVMQTDGNFVVYSSGGAALWNSGTAGLPGGTLLLQNDGNLIVWHNQFPRWRSNTGGR